MLATSTPAEAVTKTNSKAKAAASHNGNLVSKILSRWVFNHLLLPISIEREPIYFQPIKSLQDQKIFDLTVKAMRCFFNYEELRDGILVHSGLGGLVTRVFTKLPIETGQVQLRISSTRK